MRDMIEVKPIVDTFITTLGKMERVAGSCMRFYFCVEQDGELVVQSKFVVPIECVRQIAADRIRMMNELADTEGAVLPGEAA